MVWRGVKEWMGIEKRMNFYEQNESNDTRSSIVHHEICKILGFPLVCLNEC